MSSRNKKQNASQTADSDDQPVSKRLRRQRTSTAAATPTCAPKTSTSSKSTRTSNSNNNNDQSKSSTSNSLLCLNDKSLHALFEHLDIESLCQMANVCKRFRTTAEKVFEKKHQQFKLERSSCKISIMRRVLCKFGHLIKSFDASDAYFAGRTEPDVSAIAKYCSNNLDELYVHDTTINCDASLRKLFGRLKKLELTMCDITGSPETVFANLSQLEVLSFEASGPCRFLIRKYPKLQELCFDVADSSPGYSVSFDLLANNPQLRRLTLLNLPQDIHISAVVNYLKNLECLRYQPGSMSSMPEIQTKSVFLQLSKLKKLKKLDMNAGYEIYGKLAGPLMDAFAKAKIQLDFLELNDFLITSKDVKSVLKMKAMETLILSSVVQINEADVIALATELPSLSTLHLYFDSEVKQPITIDGLTKIVKNRKKLAYIGLVDVQNLKIDQKAFENLMKTARNRRGENEKKLVIHIFGNKKTTSFNVPDALRKSAGAILEIKYVSTDNDDDDDDDDGDIED